MFGLFQKKRKKTTHHIVQPHQVPSSQESPLQDQFKDMTQGIHDVKSHLKSMCDHQERTIETLVYGQHQRLLPRRISLSTQLILLVFCIFFFIRFDFYLRSQARSLDNFQKTYVDMIQQQNDVLKEVQASNQEVCTFVQRMKIKLEEYTHSYIEQSNQQIDLLVKLNDSIDTHLFGPIDKNDHYEKQNRGFFL